MHLKQQGKPSKNGKQQLLVVVVAIAAATVVVVEDLNLQKRNKDQIQQYNQIFHPI